MGWYNGKTCRLVMMMSMTLAFFVVELVIGHIANSLALIADSFHMLSDVVALVVGLLSIKFAKRRSSHSYTYGWARAEVVGALINAVFLVALCFTILVEALERLITRESIEDAYLLLWVGGAGLVINLVGLCLFHNQAHGHTHGGMSHSHGGHGHSHSHKKTGSKLRAAVEEAEDYADVKLSSVDSSEDDQMNAPLNLETSKGENHANPQQLNMRGVFLHVLGDALGSVVVMISAGVTILIRELTDHCHESRSKRFLGAVENHTAEHSHDHNSTRPEIPEPCFYSDPDWLQCVDPILSLLLVVIILCTSIPLLKQTAAILMQTVPKHIAVKDMQTDVLKTEGVIGVHEFHVWSLAGNRIIASLHVIISENQDFVEISNRVKHYFHSKGIHSVTIQPEFIERHICREGRVCALERGPDLDCHKQTCCAMNTQCSEKSVGDSDSQPFSHDESV